MALRSAGDLGMLQSLLVLVFIAEVVAVDWHEVFPWHQCEIQPFHLARGSIPSYQVTRD